MVAEALQTILAIDHHLEIVGISGDVESNEIGRWRPDIVLLDLDGLRMTVEESIAACNAVYPLACVCVISVQLNPRIMQRVLAARAAAYIVKDTQPAVLVEILRSVANGNCYADPRLAGLMLRRWSTRVSKTSVLSNREIEIVQLITEGLSNREIGSRVALSEKTVKNHVSQILVKLKLPARTGVAVYALRNGIVK
ncbi:MAG: response regulator transcription factor [Candidatus Velthaea sp.]